VEVQDGVERVQLHIGLGWQGLEEEIERFKDRPEMTKLKTDMEGVDPDEIYSKVPYEKGFQFLRRLEFQVGRETFDEFLKKYIAKFRFQSINTETFLVFLKENLPRIEEQVDLQNWIHGTGIPDDAVRPKEGILERVQNLADGFQSGAKPSGLETEKWQAQEWIVFIERLPKVLPAEKIQELEESYHFSDSPNWEIKMGILVIGANSAYQPFYSKIEDSLHHVGRMKYLKPLYQGLVEGSEEGKKLAIKVFAEANSKYHPIAQVVIQGLLTRHTEA
jgi:leukotriene-A4 hydrolase